MSTTNTSKSFQTTHKSIIKEIIHVESSGSDCISDDDHNHQISSHVDTSTQTIETCCSHGINTTNICCNNNNTSLETTIPFSSQSSRTPHNYRYFNHNPIRSPSHSPYHGAHELPHIRITSCRSHSHENLSHQTLGEKLTRDSGTYDSTENLPSTTPIHYELVPIFGQTNVALMSNRYEFDQAKVDEYLSQKHKNILSLPVNKNSHLISPILKRKLKVNKRNTNDELLPPKPNTVISFFRKVLKSSSTNEIFIEPIIRHHSSHNIKNENH